MTGTQKEVINIVSQVLQCEPESLSKDSRLGRHENWDSLAQVTIMLMLEEEYMLLHLQMALLNPTKRHN